jgi:hypothetical protein
MDATTLRCWRIGLLVILVIEAAVLGYAAWSLQRFKPILDGNPVYLWLASSSVAMTLLYGATVGALVGFLGRRGRLVWGFVALAGMKILFEVFATMYSAHHQDFFQSGAILLGFVLGEAYAYCIGLRESRGDDEWLACKQFGATAAIALFAATYVAAGTSKIIYGGVSWIDSSTIRLMVAAHTEIGTGAWKDAIGQWVAASPEFCSFLQIGTVIIQVGSILLVAGNRIRTWWAILIVLFHLGIYFPSNILFLQPLIFAAILAFPWRRVMTRSAGREAPPDGPTWPLPPEQVAGGQRTWLKLAIGLVIALWVVSSGFTWTDLWLHLWRAATG